MMKEMKFLGKTLKINLRSDADLSVFEEIFVDRDYKILDGIIEKADSCIVDIGAHIGLFSLYVNCLNPDVKVVAFEPNEENFCLLKANLKMNHVNSVVARNLAIACSSGERKFYLSVDSHNHSLVKFSENLVERKVNCVAFPDVIREKCDLVKMDAEGGEFEILQNVSDDVFSKIRNFYIEYHEYSSEMIAEKLKSILEKAGYNVQRFPSHYDKRMGFLLAKK